jgi:hypothetical protein
MANISSLVPRATYNGQALALSVDPFNPSSGQVVVAILDTGNKYQLWDSVVWQNGYVFVNLATGMVLAAQGKNSPVTLAPKNQVGDHSIWTPGGGGPFIALRPQYDDDQNLNVRGDGPYPPGTQVLTWTWGGGDPNEVWEIQPVQGAAVEADAGLAAATY